MCFVHVFGGGGGGGSGGCSAGLFSANKNCFACPKFSLLCTRAKEMLKEAKEKNTTETQRVPVRLLCYGSAIFVL